MNLNGIIKFNAARCQKMYERRPCEHATRLPLPNPKEPETYQINSPTGKNPLLVLCNQCWQLSQFSSPDDLEEIHVPRSPAPTNILFYCIEIACGVVGCEVPIRIYLRDTDSLPERNAFAYTMKALGGLEARCPKGHLLSKSSTRQIVRVLNDPY
jgi:hypothetical protein